ncbi:hypothetical protein A2U01_0004651, partial [Trifolium medium]|nr:hypothetical protein [Trifolium medium]
TAAVGAAGQYESPHVKRFHSSESWQLHFKELKESRHLDVAKELNVQHMPTFVLLKKGKEVDKITKLAFVCYTQLLSGGVRKFVLSAILAVKKWKSKGSNGEEKDYVPEKQERRWLRWLTTVKTTVSGSWPGSKALIPLVV